MSEGFYFLSAAKLGKNAVHAFRSLELYFFEVGD